MVVKGLNSPPRSAPAKTLQNTFSLTLGSNSQAITTDTLGNQNTAVCCNLLWSNCRIPLPHYCCQICEQVSIEREMRSNKFIRVEEEGEGGILYVSLLFSPLNPRCLRTCVKYWN